jgi:hypothetical protein
VILISWEIEKEMNSRFFQCKKQTTKAMLTTMKKKKYPPRFWQEGNI